MIIYITLDKMHSLKKKNTFEKFLMGEVCTWIGFIISSVGLCVNVCTRVSFTNSAAQLIYHMLQSMLTNACFHD